MGRYDGKASEGLCGAEASQKKQFVPPMGRFPKRNSLYLRWGGTMAKQAEGCAMASGAVLKGFEIAESI